MTTGREYLDFILEIRDLDVQTNTFKVAVLPSAAVGETPAASVPYCYDEVAEALADLEEQDLDQAGLVSLGEQLSDRLLPLGPVRDLFKEAVKRSGRDKGVRLRLLIHEPRLAQLPWEFSYLQMHGGEKDRTHFLVLNPQISLVRHEPLPEAHPSLIGTTPERLRLVAAMANPKAHEQLKLKEEKRVIEKALSGFNIDGVTIEWDSIIEDATPDDLRIALQSKADLFHFAGHGEFQEQDIDPHAGEPMGMGSIVLVKDKKNGEPFWLGAKELAVYLQNAGVRLAVLGACESGRRDGISAWTGVASALVERGMPAVVAMQYKVDDKRAIAFSQTFYASLASGLSVDEAVSAGRLAILGKSGEDDMDWGVPVLYMRSGDGMIFPQLAERKSETADQIRRVVEQVIKTIEQGGEVTGIKSKNVKGSFEVSQKVYVVKGKLIGWDQR
jgi:hypothetical protein